MISFTDMQRFQNQRGITLGEVRKADSEMIMNATFTGDTGYKRVYVLDPVHGWRYVDAKYSKHATQSILKDDVDYYLQFRPHEHYPVGTYVFIPNDGGPDIGFAVDNPINPFEDRLFKDLFESGKLWLIANRNNAVSFVRYNILPCNHEFKWISVVNGERRVMHVYGMYRMANSYTSWRQKCHTARCKRKRLQCISFNCWNALRAS